MKILPNFMLLPFLIKKPIWLVITVPAIAIVPTVVDFIRLCYILFWMFIIDFITGVGASYCEWKRLPEKEDKWFFGKGEGFSSKKAKSLGLKAIVYIGLPLLILEFQIILGIKNIKYETFSDSEFELASIFVIFFCLIEGFSIFNENLPKCGFNIFSKIKEIIGFYKKVKKEIE
jgi:hypothetical protein